MQTFQSIEGDTQSQARHTLETVHRAAVAAHSAEALDAGVLALALWMADPDPGEIVATMAYRKGRKGIENVRCLRVVYREGHSGAPAYWHSGGVQTQDEFDAWGQKQWTVSENRLHIPVAVENLAGFATEWLWRLDFDEILSLLSPYQMSRCPSEYELENSRLFSPAWLKTDGAPFTDPSFPALAINGSSTAALREIIMGAPFEFQTPYVRSAVLNGRCDWVGIFLEVRHPPMALLEAAANRIDVVSYLSKLGVNVAGGRNSRGGTLLHLTDSDEVVEFLLERGVDVLALDNDGRTALHYQLERPNTEEQTYPDIVRERLSRALRLIESGISPFHTPAAPADDYLTPFQHAVKHGSVEQVAVLVEAFGVDLGQRTLSGHTLVQISGSNEDMKQFLRSGNAEASTGDAREANKPPTDQVPDCRNTGPAV